MLVHAFGQRRTPISVLLLVGAPLVLVALAIRLLYLADLAPSLNTAEQPGVRMAVRYTAAARALLDGDGVLYPRVWPDRSDTALLSRPPGYPAFVAAVYATIGRTYVDVLLVQILLGATVPLLLMLLATRIAGLAAGLATGVLAAASPPLAFFCSVVTPDSITTLLAVVFVLLLWLTRRRAWAACLLLGATAGATSWLRPNFLLLSFVIAPFLPLVFGRTRPMLWRAAGIAAISAAIVAPITIRNYRLYGEFVAVSTNMGIVLWEGIADAGGNRFGARRYDLLVAQEEAERFGDPRYAKWWASPDGVQRDRDRLRRGMRVARENPGWFARATLRRALEVLDVRPAAPAVEPSRPALVEGTTGAHPAVAIGREIVGIRRGVRALQQLATQAAPLLGTAGLVLLLWCCPRRALVLLLLPLYVLLMQAPMHFEPRFALPLYALATVFQGIACGTIGSALWRRLALRRSS